jgi:murein DD-endopeptidase MepM/ murein hydrolase activator NlpD
MKLWRRSLRLLKINRSMRRRPGALRNRRLIVEQFESRYLLADISFSSIQLIEKANLSTSITPIIGEQVCIRANYSTSNLPAGSSYRIEFDLDNVPISANNVTNGAGIVSNNWYYYQCGWYASPGQHSAQVIIDADNTVAETNELNNTKATPLLFTPVAPTTLPQKLLNPMGGVPFHDWRFSNYVDVDPSSGFKDFQGGTIAYDGHDAHDIGITNFARMDAGIPEYAAADGVVEQTQDGNFDRNNTRGSRPANYIIINHGNGWRTIYYHLMANSITVQVGDTVTAGQFLGLVGSAGDSNGPHLHFGITHNNNAVESEYDPTDYYVSPFGYQGSQSTYVIDALVTSFSPTSSDFDERPAEQTIFSTQTPQTPVFVFWFATLASGEHLDLTEYRPDGTVNSSNSTLVQGPLNSGSYWWRPSTTPISSNPGTWRLVISKNGVELASRSFVVTPGPGYGQIKVTQNGSDISDNRTTAVDFGSTAAGSAAVSQTFTVNNVGSAPLTLSGLTLPPGFALNGTFPSSVAAGGSSTFTVNLTSSAAGSKFGAIQFSTTDPDSPTFNFNVSGTVTGAAPAAAPVLSISGPALAYTKIGQAMLIKPAGTLADADSATFAGGTLTAEFTSISSTADVLGIQSGDVGSGQIGVNGTSVLYGGVMIGTFAGGAGGTPLSISFNGSATPDAVQAVLRSITFSTTTTHPDNLSRYVRLSLTDESGNLSNQPIAVVDQNLYPTTASIDASGNLLIADSSVAGKDDVWRLERSGDNLKLTDLSGYFIDASSITGATGSITSVVTIPLAAVSPTAQVILDTRNGNDSLTIDLSSGDPIPAGGISVLGGDPTIAPGDKLTITGGDQGTVTYNYSNASSHDGSIVMSNFGTVSYTGLEPIVNTGTATDIVFNLPAGPNTAMLGDDGTVGNSLSRLSAATFEKTDFANPTGSLTINAGSSTDILTVNSVPDFSAGLTIGSATNSFGSLTFAGAVVVAADSNVTAYASGKISLPNVGSSVAASGVGSITLTTTRNIVVSTGANLSVVDGNLNLTSNAAGTTGGNFSGISMSGTLKTTGMGDINLSGTGGVDPNTSLHIGVDILRGSVLSTASGASAGKITIIGRGGVGTADNDGVAVEGTAGLVQSDSGEIRITGYGGNGSTTLNRGIAIINGGQIKSVGTGSSAANIKLTGVGGTGTDSCYGVEVYSSSGIVSSVDGDITLIGSGGALATGSFEYGVFVGGAARVISTGTGISAGNIIISGTGGGTGINGSDQNQGVRIDGAGTEVDSVDGSVSITGFAGVATTTTNTFSGIRLVNSAAVRVTGAGLLTLDGKSSAPSGSVGYALRLDGTIVVAGSTTTLIGDTILLNPSSFILDAGTNTVVLRPQTLGRPIQLGRDDTAFALGLNDDELNTISAGSLNIGDSNSGAITISADVSCAPMTMVGLTSGSDITFSGGGFYVLDGTLMLMPGDSSSVTAPFANVDVFLNVNGSTALSFTDGSDLTLALNGTDDFDQLDVQGDIDLTGVNLMLSGSYIPQIGDQFLIVNNRGIHDIAGEFIGLPDGKPFHVASGAGAGDYLIDYHGGDGNDVVITTLTLSPTLDFIANPPGIFEDSSAQTLPLSGIHPGYGHSIVSVTAVSFDQSLVLNPQIDYTGPASTASLSFHPEKDQFGAVIIQVSVQDDGPSGANTVTQFFTVTVNPINDPPSFSHLSGNYSAADEDSQTHGPAGQQSVPGWGANITAGPANESNQQLSFKVTPDNKTLFAVQPAVGLDGTLTYTPAPNAHGVSNVTVVLQDDDDGNNTSQQASFQIEIVKAHPLHNSSESGKRNGRDVTGSTSVQPDGFIVAGDVLAVINYINAKGSGQILSTVQPGPPYPDVNGDDQVVAQDVLDIINYINSHPGQSEAADDLAAAPDVEINPEVAPQFVLANATTLDLLTLLAADSAAVELKRRRSVS